MTENSVAVHIFVLLLNGIVALSAFSWVCSPFFLFYYHCLRILFQMFIGTVSDTIVSRVTGKSLSGLLIHESQY